MLVNVAIDLWNESWNLKRKVERNWKNFNTFLGFKDSSIFFIHKRNLEGNVDSTTCAPQQEVFIPFKKRSCLARSELLHLESIKWIKFHQWSGHSTFVFLSLLFLLDCWQLLLLSTSSKSSTLWNCNRTRGGSRRQKGVKLKIH